MYLCIKKFFISRKCSGAFKMFSLDLMEISESSALIANLLHFVCGYREGIASSTRGGR
jgi:hypothetical protein